MTEDKQRNEFEQASEGERIGFFAEFIEFLKYNKKWWLLPIIVSMLGLGILVAMSSSAAAPFIYTLF